ncbi:MAG: secondary thiamine-phosphate synthase enzyme YjbQ [Gammaproteobacteria bacterium]|nr:secondary thiamine-phosphate synthase enzyme YjbQ [Gammaproteobacteria bacterium]NNF61501.1 YjbQ family protein [Gammaproteobacteria bacterium]
MQPHVYRASRFLEAEFGHADVTDELAAWVDNSGIKTGVLTVQLVGSTGGVTTIEYESGALADLQRAFNTLAPANEDYQHNERWHDGNGFSHLRSALLKTGIALPIIDGRLQLGTWQQVVAINFDNHARDRELVGVIIGD